MDKEILPQCKSIFEWTHFPRNKPPILPKPKIIPEKPRIRAIKDLISPSDDVLGRLNTPYSCSGCSTDNENGFQAISSDGLSGENTTESNSNSSSERSSKLYNETIEDETSPSPIPVTTCQADWLIEHKYKCDAIETEPDLKETSFESITTQWGDETLAGNGEKSDSDGFSLTSLKSLDINCSGSQDNTSFDNSLDSHNICVEHHNGFNTDSNNSKSKEKSVFLIAKEFMTSEQVYVQALRLIVVDFKEHLQSYSDSPLITAGEWDKIISSLPQLLKLNEDLLMDLEHCINNWTVAPKIADVIVKKGPFLKLYSSYMKEFEAQCSALEDLCIKCPKFSQALYDFETSEFCKKLTLKHYMLKPVQRIPQYRLLLERYLSQLEEDSEEHSNARTALKIVQDVLLHANSTIKQSDNLSKLLKLQGRLGNYEIIKPGRSFIKEGELQKLSRKEIQPRYFILLSDCLLYTTYSASSSYLRIKYELPLAGMKVQKKDTEFDVITSTRSFTLRARNEDECAEWMTSLQSAIIENNQRQLTFANHIVSKSTLSDSFKPGKEAPVWIQDKRTTMCQICTAAFTVTFRRHHCRCCGRVVCWVCSNSRAPLQYLKFHSKRVCDECYDFLQKEFEDSSSDVICCIKKELELNDSEAASKFLDFKSSFKKFDSTKKSRKSIPQRLKEVTGSDSGSQISGWLETKGRRGWKRLWFVLKDQVLYSYKASHDVMAYKTLPVLGYLVDEPHDSVDDFDKNALFRLTHHGQPPRIFLAPTEQSAKMWISALKNATVLK